MSARLLLLALLCTAAPLREAAATASVSDEDRLRKSAEALARMRDIFREVQEKQKEARATKDVVKLNCVNEKLSQIRGLLRIAEQASVGLQDALSSQEPQAAEHEYNKVSIARQKMEQLRAQANECVGQLAFRTDESLVVEVEVPNNLASADPTAEPTPEAMLFRPPPASPTL